jgi:transcriptional regulator with XRE-family HTH domain
MPVRVRKHGARQRHFIREWRKHRGYTQGQLAEIAGMSVANLSRVETGDQQYTQDLLEALAEALTVEPATLIMRLPSDASSIWSLWERASPAERQKFEALAAIILNDGTDG